MKDIKIIIQAIHPPIPSKAFDFCAYEDGDEESCCFGKRPYEALKAYLENHDVEIVEK